MDLVKSEDYKGLEAFDWNSTFNMELDMDKEKNPLYWAVENKEYKMISYLITKKGIPQDYWVDKDVVTFLAQPIEDGDMESVRLLIGAGLRPDLADLYRCNKDSDFDIMKLILPFIKNPLERHKIIEWGEPTGGTTSYIRFLAEQSEGDILLSFLLKDNPGLLDIVYSDYSAAYGPWQISHFTLANIKWGWIEKNLPGIKARTAGEILLSTKYVDIKKVFANSYIARTTSRLKLRDSPELSAGVKSVIDSGSEVKVIVSDGSSEPEKIDGILSTWYYIVTPKEERGWVWGGYLKPEGLP